MSTLTLADRMTSHVKYVLIIHEMAAYPDWKRVFDDAAPARKAAGAISYQLLRHDSAESVVVHLSHTSSAGRTGRTRSSPSG